MRPVNLMTKDATSGRSLPPVGLILAGAAPIVAIGVVAVGYSFTHGTVQKDQDQLAAVQAQVAAIPVAHSTTPAFAAISVESNSRRSSLDSALTDRFQVDSALAAIARVLPSDAWLTSLNLTSPTPADVPVAPPAVATDGSTTSTTTTTTTTATTPAPTINVNAFTINGFTYSQASVARLMTQLSLLPMLSNVTLTSTSTSTSATTSGATSTPTLGGSAKAKKPKTLVQFTVNAAVNPSNAEEGT
jgi:Tfp pilus assembly protein PilN